MARTTLTVTFTDAHTAFVRLAVARFFFWLGARIAGVGGIEWAEE